MSDWRSPICSPLDLPPDPKPFMQLHELSKRIFSPNLERVLSALAKVMHKPVDRCIFYNMRCGLSEEFLEVLKVLQSAQAVAEGYCRMLAALEEKEVNWSVAWLEVGCCAERGARCSGDARRSLHEFRGMVRIVIEELRLGRGRYKWSRKPPADEEIRLGSEIDSAIQECKAILHDCQDEFSKLTATSVVGGLIMQINPPSAGQIRVVRALWQTYLESVGGIRKDGVKMVDEILFPPGDYHEPERQGVPWWRALFPGHKNQHLTSSGDAPEEEKRSTDPEAAAVTPSESEEIRTEVIKPVEATERLRAPENTVIPNPAPSNSRTTNGLSLFWRKFFSVYRQPFSLRKIHSKS